MRVSERWRDACKISYIIITNVVNTAGFYITPNVTRHYNILLIYGTCICRSCTRGTKRLIRFVNVLNIKIRALSTNGDIFSPNLPVIIRPICCLRYREKIQRIWYVKKEKNTKVTFFI